MKRLFESLSLFISVWLVTSGLDLERCTTRPLGMESGEITDQQISASSSFDSQSVGPQNARIRTELNSGAWCPKQQIKNGSYEFLQISFNSTRVIRAVETQGRYGNGTGKEFATAYLIDYWRTRVTKWIRYQRRNGAYLIEANSDTITAVLQNLDPPLIASKIRIVPYSVQTRTTCLRVELYGCEYRDGLLSYSMSSLPSNANDQEDFTDETFEHTDDLDADFRTPKGLGLLTDGVIPKHPPFDPLYRLPFRNSTWVGWSQNDTDGRIDIRFDFDHQRLFDHVEVFGFGTRPVRQVEVEFSGDGTSFGHKVVSRYPEDLSQNKEAEVPPKHYSIKIPLNQRGQTIKMKLEFEEDWLYLSEIRFGTAFADGFSILQDFNLTNEDYGIYYILVAVLSVMFILLTTALCVMISLKKKKCPKSEKSLISSLGSPASRSTGATSLSKELKHPGTLITTLPYGNSSHQLPRHVIHSHSFAPHQGILSQHKGNLYVATEQRSPSQRLLGVTTASRSCSGTLFNSMNRDQPPSLLDINFPPPPSSTTSTTRADATTGTSNSSSEGIYAEPCSTAPLLPNHQSRHKNNSHTRRPIPKPRSRNSLTRRNKTLPSKNRPFDDPGESHYAVTHISSAESTGTSPRSNFHHNHSPHTDLLINGRFIRRSSIQLVEKIGEGKFTHVYSCRVRDDDTGTPRWAVLKRLYLDNEAARLALIAEAQHTTDLDHPHINRLLGQCEDLSLVKSLAVHGDLRSYCLKERHSLSLPQLLKFCTEIAQGMNYLTEKGIVHGHLSPKCCLLSDQKQLKVSSARGPNHHAQLRYSAPEAIVMNIWSSQSDSYSYGMTAWEVLNFCEKTPFQALTNSELINNARNLLENSPESIYPPQLSSSIGTDTDDLLRECWIYPPELRPGFREIQLFMERKLLSLLPNTQSLSTN